MQGKGGEGACMSPCARVRACVPPPGTQDRVVESDEIHNREKKGGGGGVKYFCNISKKIVGGKCGPTRDQWLTCSPPSH